MKQCEECPGIKCFEYSVGALNKRLIVKDKDVSSSYELIDECRQYHNAIKAIFSDKDLD